MKIAYHPDLDENSSCQVVKELLKLNSKVTAEAATFGSKRDADGNLISWNLGETAIIELPGSDS